MKPIFLLALTSSLIHGLSDKPATAQTIVLREAASIQRSIVYLGDVAEISADSNSTKHHLLTTPLIPAPAEGTTECIHQSQLKQLLTSQGVDVIGLQIHGAAFVEVARGELTAQAKVPPGAEPLPVLSPLELEEAIQDAIESHLVAQTGHLDWEVELSLNKTDLERIQKLGGELIASAGRSPWTGNQRFLISAPGVKEGEFVLARAEKMQEVIVVTRRLEAGTTISARDVELSRQRSVAGRPAFTTVDQVVGKESLRAIIPGEVVQANQVRSPLLVRRGETAKVRARTGGITVSTYAVARQDGGLGDLVQLESLEGKERFSARVSGWKELEVLPTGATTADFAEVSSLRSVIR